MMQYGNTNQNTFYPNFSGFFQQLQGMTTPEDSVDAQDMKNKNEHITLEVTEMKSLLQDFMTEVRTKLDTINDNVSSLMTGRQTQKPRKVFRKTLQCHFEECGKKYSSKIALKCHMRTKHRGQKVQE